MCQNFARVVLCLTLLGVCNAPWQALAQRAADPRPNVVLILVDDYGWADSGCYGSKFHHTPRIDRLAAEGIRFTDAYSAGPVCSPTRAALMTGMYPARLHLTDWLPGRPDRSDQQLCRPEIHQHLPLEATTLAESLHAAGYATGHVGKWHLGAEGFGPLEQGFDLNVAGDSTGTPLSYFAPFQRNGRYMPGLEQAPEHEYLTDRLTSEAETFIAANRERPFFLYMPHYAVHLPMEAKQDLVDKYPAELKLGQQSNGIYAAMIESVDQSVGRIVDQLQKLGLSEKTLLIFTSDNGGLATLEGDHTPATINAPLRDGKGYLYEGGIRVPLIMNWPNTIAGSRVVDLPVISHDLFPTILEACSVPLEAAVDGVSLVPVLKATNTPSREALYWHYPHYCNQGGKPGAAVRRGEFKLIEFFENGRRELYNLARDLGESRNLFADEPEVARRLGEDLDHWLIQVEAQAMRPNPDFVPNPQQADGTITLEAHTAEVHGLQLCYEPLPHKNTLGYWIRVEDTASWEFTLSKTGTFELFAWQGCGTGQGGSEVDFVIDDQQVSMTVEDTGGFQEFRRRLLGTVRLDKPGRHTLTVRPRTKAKDAIMDLRQVLLRKTS